MFLIWTSQANPIIRSSLMALADIRIQSKISELSREIKAIIFAACTETRLIKTAIICLLIFNQNMLHCINSFVHTCSKQVFLHTFNFYGIVLYQSKKCRFCLSKHPSRRMSSKVKFSINHLNQRSTSEYLSMAESFFMDVLVERWQKTFCGSHSQNTHGGLWKKWWDHLEPSQHFPIWDCEIKIGGHWHQVH